MGIAFAGFGRREVRGSLGASLGQPRAKLFDGIKDRPVNPVVRDDSLLGPRPKSSLADREGLRGFLLTELENGPTGLGN